MNIYRITEQNKSRSGTASPASSVGARDPSVRDLNSPKKGEKHYVGSPMSLASPVPCGSPRSGDADDGEAETDTRDTLKLSQLVRGPSGSAVGDGGGGETPDEVGKGRDGGMDKTELKKTMSSGSGKKGAGKGQKQRPSGKSSVRKSQSQSQSQKEKPSFTTSA